MLSPEERREWLSLLSDNTNTVDTPIVPDDSGLYIGTAEHYIMVDVKSQSVTNESGTAIELDARSFSILAIVAAIPNTVITHGNLKVWSHSVYIRHPDSQSYRSLTGDGLRAHVCNLRHQLGDPYRDSIKAKRGVGYMGYWSP